MIESSRSKGTISSASSSLAELLVERDAALPLAVVAEPPRLDDRRQPRLGQRAEPGRRDAEALEQLLLDEAVLPQLERERRR